MRNIEISQEPVELYKILKFEGLVASGADAKSVIESGLVLVNGVIETVNVRKWYQAILSNLLMRLAT